MSEQTAIELDEWMDGWTERGRGGMDERMDGWMDGQTNK
jgi:hypothetical protein